MYTRFYMWGIYILYILLPSRSVGSLELIDQNALRRLSMISQRTAYNNTYLADDSNVTEFVSDKTTDYIPQLYLMDI